MIQQTLVLVKPDGIQRGLIGEIIKRFEQRGLKIIGMKMTQPKRETAKEHYGEEIAKRHGAHVLEALADYLSSSPVIAMVIEGSSAISTIRKISGDTYPGEAAIGTIRGDFAHVSKQRAKQDSKATPNLVHASGNE